MHKKTVSAPLLIVAGSVLAGWSFYRSGETLQHVISGIMLAAVVFYIAWLYGQKKEVRTPLHRYLAWGCALWAPFVIVGFLRDYWMNAWFQQTLFPAMFLPLLALTLLGTIAIGVRLGFQLYWSNVSR